MYRVAIIQNENEVIRSGFANVMPRLTKISRFKDYNFVLFNVTNINRLFIPGDDYLLGFDSVIVTTNSTSEPVLNVLRDNKSAIDDFLKKGRGIFIASQKKLSTVDFDANKNSGKTGFLPDIYDFYTVERPKEEKDSGRGDISQEQNNDSLLLTYPRRVTSEMTKSRCESNEFKKHFYRSHIITCHTGIYQTIFFDKSYQNVSHRNLLMANISSAKGERIVLSTIAVDWEFHEALLTNIITYISEGYPEFAFINKEITANGDFDFLLSSAKLSKIAHMIYKSPEEIKSEWAAIHKTFIFSPEWDEDEIGSFLDKQDRTNLGTNAYKAHVRVFYFHKIQGRFALSKYSNYSTVDTIIDSAVLWINTKFKGKMWGNSFWTSYDILQMFYKINYDASLFLPELLKDIRKHLNNNNYDGMIGATCGMVDLIIKMYERPGFKDQFQDFNQDNLLRMVKWILGRFSSQSLYDQQSIYLCLTYNAQKSEWLGNLLAKNHTFSRIIQLIENSLTDKNELVGASETDICRLINLCLISGKIDYVDEYLTVLRDRQSTKGKWTNIGRTAYVIIFLLENIHSFAAYGKDSIVIDEMIYNGILYLRSTYDWSSSNWKSDIQATAKAIHAISLYNEHFKYSTQDFFETLQFEGERINAAVVMKNATDGINILRQKVNELASELNNKNISLNELGIQLERKEEHNRRSIDHHMHNEKILKRLNMVATVFGTLFFGFVMYLTIKYPARVLQELKSINVVDGVIGLVLGIIITAIAQLPLAKKPPLEKQ